MVNLANTIGYQFLRYVFVLLLMSVSGIIVKYSIIAKNNEMKNWRTAFFGTQLLLLFSTLMISWNLWVELIFMLSKGVRL